MVKKRKTILYIFLGMVMISLLIGCATTGKKSALPEISCLIVTEENADVVEYKGSDIDESIPRWMKMSPEELESNGDFNDRYVFIFEIQEADLDTLKDRLQEYPYSRHTSRAVNDRVRARVGEAPAFSKSFLDEAGRVLTAIEYMGARRYGDFWVHEILFDNEKHQIGERYRGWILVTVPKAQVRSALAMAYETAESHQPPENEYQVKEREGLLARFRLGL